MDHAEAGKINDDVCTFTRDYICKKGAMHSLLALLFISFLVYIHTVSVSSLHSQGTRTSTSAADVWTRSVLLLWSGCVYSNTSMCELLKLFVTGWNEKCGSWAADPFNDYCYLFNYLSLRTWAEARTDCMNQGGDLVSITDPFEQAFVQGLTNTTSFLLDNLLTHDTLISKMYWILLCLNLIIWMFFCMWSCCM